MTMVPQFCHLRPARWLWVSLITLIALAITAVLTAFAVQITAEVSKNQYLPPDLYGQWQVEGQLLDTNAPGTYAPVIQEVWFLQQQGQDVVLANPTNGASAVVGVEQVHDNTATFHRTTQIGNKLFTEVPTLTVSDDTFTGEAFTTMTRLSKQGEPLGKVWGRFKLVGHRMGPRISRQAMPEPDLEIDDVQSHAP
jgi:hypothetical protein